MCFHASQAGLNLKACVISPLPGSFSLCMLLPSGGSRRSPSLWQLAGSLLDQIKPPDQIEDLIQKTIGDFLEVQHNIGEVKIGGTLKITARSQNEVVPGFPVAKIHSTWHYIEQGLEDRTKKVLDPTAPPSTPNTNIKVELPWELEIEWDKEDVPTSTKATRSGI
ncbi:hypothetical protein J3R30DRAFT_3713876 [Lentinula aciculospora]|uniref:Uncharacterized protein n=1 Tax=Lentinula aciculospora TaxID=153920 RepID=A0A9W9DH56_9AGAR|nr:hypothetical protein J3R30DRAFT_3713876 [Lentinula aciculospora]